MSRHRNKPEARAIDRHVRLYHWIMRTAAWKSLPPAARALYAELARHYNGKNNGRIAYSIRQAAADLGTSLGFTLKLSAMLQERGFIVVMQKGAFSVKKRHATEWRLTEFICDVTGQVPSKEFAHWQQPPQNLEHGITRRSITRLTVSLGEAWVSETPLYASLRDTVEGAPASPHDTLLVNQGVAAAPVASPALAAVVRRKGWVNDH
jgi:hypothetical protein